jgi:hypothetical protein
MHADKQRSGQPGAKDGRRWRSGSLLYGSWSVRKAMMSLPAFQRRALHRIEQTLAAEDPSLRLRFAVFARLTRHEAMPRTEQLPRRSRRFLRRATTPPLMVISLAVAQRSLSAPRSYRSRVGARRRTANGADLPGCKSRGMG